jgi:hypothetical protein
MRTCLLCGRPIPKQGLINYLLHGPDERRCDPPDEACWRGFNIRMGLDPDRPRPGVIR